jgi:RimJ/RimL family protein N-acetyltransferase
MAVSMKPPMPPPPRWAVRGLSLRPATPGDRDFLRVLFGDVRAEEIASTGWPAERGEAFLDSQFALQTTHFDTYYGDGDVQIIEAAGRPIGRLHLHDSAEGRLVVDISLLRGWRGQGLGASLLRQVQAQTRRSGLPRTWLHVAAHNFAAVRLYERLGFKVVERDATYWRMDWTP